MKSYTEYTREELRSLSLTDIYTLAFEAVGEAQQTAAGRAALVADAQRIGGILMRGRAALAAKLRHELEQPKPSV